MLVFCRVSEFGITNKAFQCSSVWSYDSMMLIFWRFWNPGLTSFHYSNAVFWFNGYFFIFMDFWTSKVVSCSSVRFGFMVCFTSYLKFVISHLFSSHSVSIYVSLSLSSFWPCISPNLMRVFLLCLSFVFWLAVCLFCGEQIAIFKVWSFNLNYETKKEEIQELDQWYTSRDRAVKTSFVMSHKNHKKTPTK